MRSQRIQVSPASLAEFELDIARFFFDPPQLPRDAETLRRTWKPPGHLFDPATRALIVSFNASWEPFLCESTGFNQEETRKYISDRGHLLRGVGVCQRF